MTSDLLAKLLLEFLVVLAAFLDLRSRSIPNWLTLPGIFAGVAVNIYQAGWIAGLKTTLFGLLLAFVIYSLFFTIRAMSGGDVKLMTAVGAFVGPQPWIWIFAITAITGGAFAVITLIRNGGFKQALGNIATILTSLSHGKMPHKDRPDLDVAHPGARTLPHGAAIAIGTLTYLLWFKR